MNLPDDSLPTTPSQQEIWFAIGMGGPESSLAFQDSYSLIVDGDLEEGTLNALWDEVLDHHPILTRVVSPDGSGMVPAPHHHWAWVILDWRTFSPSQVQARREALLGLEAQTILDGISGPLFRVHATLLPSGQTELFLTVHQLICDRTSAEILLRGLATGLRNQGQPIRQSTSFHLKAQWMQARRRGPEGDADDGFWVQALGPTPETLDLCTDFPRPSQRSFEVGQSDLTIGAEAHHALTRLSLDTGISSGTLLLGVLAGYLSRLTGQQEFVLARTVDPPELSPWSGLVGPSATTLPIPVRIPDRTPWLTLVKALETFQTEAEPHRDFSLTGLLQRLNLPRDPSRVPLIPVVFCHELRPHGAPLVTLHPRSADAFELSFLALESASELEFRVTYNKALFDGTTVGRWLEDLEETLQSVSKDPTTPVGDLNILSPTSRSLLFGAWKDRPFPLPDSSSALAMLEAQVARTPDAPAILNGTTSWTYRELDERANFLARRLLDLGVGTEDLVGVSLRRGAPMVSALWAVWKAGAAYVPLDPDFPPSRLDFILQDSDIQVLVTERSLAEVFPQDGLRRLWVDEETGRLPFSPPRTDDPGRLAYVLHTSGSTGKPKGVQIEHRSLVNFLASMGRDIQMGASDVLVAVTTLSFDIAGLELHLPLTLGARIVLASREELLDGHRLASLMKSHGATILQGTPATWQLLVDADWVGPPGFKALCGGEALPRDLANQLLKRASFFWNVYGPTETTIWSTMEPILSADQPIGIGRPIDNTTVYLVDPRLQPVPIGATGELLIGGAGVSRGYWKRPELTVEKFLSDPFSDRPGARVYRTGDLCRFGPDGRIFFLRRNDSQVKVRGFRIELGEIETAASALPGVLQAVALVRDFGAGDNRLVVYLVPPEGKTLDPTGWKDFLTGRLPHYMVPQHVVVLSRFPLTPNGKIDRKALPLPTVEGGSLPPQDATLTPLEQQVASVWASLLKTTSIGRQDSFFDLGGHSLLVARMVARLKEAFGADVSMRTIFQNPTLEAVALQVSQVLVPQTSTNNGEGPLEEYEF